MRHLRYENNIIQNEVEVALKSGKRKDQLIQNLTISDITRRIKYLKFYLLKYY